jgi:RNA polymerase sigma-70 factor (sigma-E family)
VPAAVRLGYLLTGDPQRAEDLAHDAFVRCVGRFTYLRTQTSFEAYLRRAVVNLHTSKIRHRYVEREWLRREGPRQVHATTSLPDVEGREDLWRALGTLPPRQRAALVLRYYEDLSEHDTAATLRCSVAAVKSLVSRGSQALRASIAEGDTS